MNQKKKIKLQITNCKTEKE